MDIPEIEIPSQKRVKTKDIKQALTDFASERAISESMHSYSIQEVITYIKTGSDDDFKLFSGAISEYYKDRGEITNKHIEIKQLYTILIEPKVELDFSLIYEVDTLTNIYKPTLTIDPKSHIPYEKFKPQETFNILVDEFDKIKAQHSIIIEFFDESMIKTLKAFTKHLYQGKFSKKVKIPLFDGIEQEPGMQGKLILSFEEKDRMREVKKQIVEVDKDEVIAKFLKPRYGRNGFNAYGEQVVQSFGRKIEDLQIPHDDASIYIEEDEEQKLYRSREKGFVRLTTRLFSVENKLTRSQLSRHDESIADDENNNIEVHISQSDKTKDSIGDGVTLESETIGVTGHVGANSILKAVNLSIDGATHSSSKQFAKTAVINRHKGELRCNSAKIKLLEGGVVYATDLELESSLGGTIYAKNVTIGHVKHNLKIYASESIKIRLVSGEDNFLTMDYRNIPTEVSKIEAIEEEIDELRFSLIDAKLHNKEKALSLQSSINSLKGDIKKVQESVFHASIEIDKPLIGLNTISFVIDKDDELVFKTKNTQYSKFYLKTTDDKIVLHPVKISIPLKI